MAPGTTIAARLSPGLIETGRRSAKTGQVNKDPRPLGADLHLNDLFGVKVSASLNPGGQGGSKVGFPIP